MPNNLISCSGRQGSELSYLPQEACLFEISYCKNFYNNGQYYWNESFEIKERFFTNNFYGKELNSTECQDIDKLRDLKRAILKYEVQLK